MQRSSALALALAALASAAHAGVTQNSLCVDDLTALTRPNQVPNNCTANDVTFVLVGLGVQTNGCVTTNDTVSIRLRATLQNTTAQARYDIGMFISQDGTSAQSGATTCARADLEPIRTPGNPSNDINLTTCGAGALDLDGPVSGVDNNVLGIPDGPYLMAETGGSNSTPDVCGDLFAGGNNGCDENGDGVWDDSLFQFPDPVTFPCRDLPEVNGFVNLPTCATWGQQANGVNDGVGNATCDSQAEIVPGTKAKCNCQEIETDIPVPSLSLSCPVCTPNTVVPGGSTTCTVTYTNNTTCTPDLSTAERFRCGTGSFLRFKVDYDETRGSVSGLGATDTGTTVDDGSQITWTPRSSAGTLGIIGAGRTGTLTYTYTYALDGGGQPPVGSFTMTTSSWWSNVSSFSPEVEQSSALSCSNSISATPVTLAAVDSRRLPGGRVAVEWSTATEAGNVGFNVYEKTKNGLRQLNDQLIAARGVNSVHPQRYRFVGERLAGGELVIEDVAIDGSSKRHGPFPLGEAVGRAPQLEEIDWPGIRSEQARRSTTQLQSRAASKGIRMSITETGLYRVTYEQLAAAGLSVGSLKPDSLAVLHRGEPVAIRVGGNAKTFGPGSWVELYAEAIDSLYTGENVYDLVVDRSRAARIGTASATPASGAAIDRYDDRFVSRRDLLYNFGSPTDDPWFDTSMLAFTSPRQWTFPFQIESLASSTEPTALTVSLHGVTNWPAAPDHHVLVRLNGVPVASDLFDGGVARSIAAQLPAGLLLEGANQLTLELPGDTGVAFDLVNLDSYTVTYPRLARARQGRLELTAAGGTVQVSGLPASEAVVYRLTSGVPTLLSGVVQLPQGAAQSAVRFAATAAPEAYLVSAVSALRSPQLAPLPSRSSITTGGRADLLIVAHGNFVDDLAPLVARRESEGKRVRVVDVQDIYDQLGYGIVDPQPIADYIAFAVRQFGVTSALLVGGDTYDYKNHLGLGSISFLPTPYAATTSIVTYAPVDALYADLDGDQVPDLPIGRFPVRTSAELQTLIGKTLDYGAEGYAAAGVFAADRADSLSGLSFSQESDRFISALPGEWQPTRAYLDSVGTAAARQALFDAVGQGAALTNFTGHSGPSTWTFSGLFDASDVAQLANQGRPTVVVQWGCWNTYYVEPAYNTLAHTFLLTPDRGAAAVIGSSALSWAPSSAALSDELAPLIAVPGVTLGEAITEAKHRLAARHPEMLDVLLGWTLLGDPSVVVSP